MNNLRIKQDTLIFDPSAAVKVLGKDQIITQTFEELGELTQALSKKKRSLINDKTLRKSKEEIADVEICLRNLKLLFDIDEKSIKKKKYEKLRRMEKLLLSDDTKDTENIIKEAPCDNEE